MLYFPFFFCSWLATGAHALVATSGFRLLGDTIPKPRFQHLSPETKRTFFSLSMVLRDSTPPDFSVVKGDNDAGDDEDRIKNQRMKPAGTDNWKRSSKSPSSSRRDYSKMAGTSWLQKNAAFNNEDIEESDKEPATRINRTFRQDFQGTRVFVKGIPFEASWQDLKDHFAKAGTVVFASISVDPVTGESKGVGIVQFETNDMAQNAIRVMRNHPLQGSTLYVREDVQEKRADGARLRNPTPRNMQRNTPPSKWECADDENSSVLSAEERESVISLIGTRDAARRKKLYDESDQIRRDLKSQFGVHLDDRLKQWWVSFDGSHVPNSIAAVKGEGRWGGKKEWRQIPTTLENDACVNPDLVNGLLKQRDIARREKDFDTADALLAEARSSPDGELYLRIHDESRTWRIWTAERPPRPMSVDRATSRKSAAEQCIDLIREKAPHKEVEIVTLLRKFPGREYPILKRLRKSLKDE